MDQQQSTAARKETPHLVSRFRSSHPYAARSLANFGIKGTLAIYDSSGPILTFASVSAGSFCECWNQRTTSKYNVLVEFWI